MGVGTIMEARQIALLAFGRNKAQAVADAVEGPSRPDPGVDTADAPAAKIVLDEPRAYNSEG